MTIKEAENRTGLARANIRYYEDQGFFSAARGENGYRNYSEEDIDILLKVKLLRQLGFSLEDIHALQNGEQTLGPALEQREAGLEQERRELEQLLGLCRTMREEGADFCTLDARRYLDALAREETVLAKDRDPARIFPWRRYFARTLDLTLYKTLILFVLQLTARLNLVRMQKSGGEFLLTLGGLALMLGAEILMLRFWGTTPGKALLGLKILREDGSRLGLAESGQRTSIAVLYFGLAQCLIESQLLLLSVAGIAMLVWACWQVYHEHPMSWEEDWLYLDGGTRGQPFWENNWNMLRIAGYLAALALCTGLIAGGHYLAARPACRGPNLTAEEFVENYNQYMTFTYGEENLSRRLTADGTFAEMERPGVIVVDPFQDKNPIPEAAFRFTQEGGRLTGVTLVQQYENDSPVTADETYVAFAPFDEIYVAVRSFLWRQLGDKGVSDLCAALEGRGGNFHETRDGVRIDSEMRFSGYEVWGDRTFFAREGRAQSYFVEFTMKLTE